MESRALSPKPSPAAAPVPPRPRAGRRTWLPWRGAVPGPHQRIRLAVLVLLGLVALAASTQAWRFDALERQRQSDLRLHGLAMAVNGTAQSLAWAAARALQAGVAPADALARLQLALDHSRGEALQLDALVQAQQQRLDAAGDPAGAAALGLALEQWHQSRERLWYRAEALLAALEARQPARIAAAAPALQAEAEPASHAGVLLSGRAAAASEQMREDALARWRRWSAAILGMLVLLILLVGEPINF